MAIKWAQKDPDEEYEYTHDWGPRLLVDGADVGDSIVPATDPDPTKHPDIDVVEGDVEVTAIVPVPDTDKLQYWLRGGTIKSRLTATIWTAQGRKYQESFVLPIKQR